MAGKRRLTVELIGDERSLNSAFKSGGAGASRFGKQMNSAGRASSKASVAISKVAKTGALAGVALGGGLAVGLKKSIEAFAESEAIAKQTNAVIKSTGKVAKVTAKDVDHLATRLSRKSGVDDELIASGQNVLLTFTKVRNEAGLGNKVFDRATRAALDMSVALGTDLKAANIQVGKALNDPVKGTAALSKAGIQFTKGQKEKIASLVEEGDTLKAQKLILRELNTQFGGSAKAAGETTTGAFNKLKVAVGNVQEAIGGALAPALAKGASAAAKFVNEISSGEGAGGRFAERMVTAFNAVKAGVQSAIPTAVAVFGRLKGAITTVVGTVVGLVRGFRDGKAGATALAAGLGTLLAGFAAMRIVGTVIAGLKALRVAVIAVNVAMRANPIGLVITAIAGLAAGLVFAYKKSATFRRVVDGAFKGVKAAGKWLVQAGRDVAQWATNAVGNVKRFARGFGKWIGNAVKDVKAFPGKVLAVFKSLPGKMLQVGKDVIQGLVDGIKAKADEAVDAIGDVADDVYDSTIGRLGIGSPSKKFRYIGEMVGKGLVVGLGSARASVANAAKVGLLYPLDAAIAALTKRKEALQATWEKIDAAAQRSGLVGALGSAQRAPLSVSGGSGGGSRGGGGDGLAWAKQMVGGFKESTGSNTGPELDQLQSEFGHRAAAWCAMFATKALVKAGAPKELLTAQVAQVRAWAEAGTHGLAKGVKKAPKVGDLMMFGNDHIGVVEKIVKGIVHTIEGNTSSGKVARRTHAIGEGDFARVASFSGGRGGGGKVRGKDRNGVSARELAIIASAAKEAGIDPAILYGVYGQETKFGKLKNSSSAGARGPFQFMPGTAKSLGIDPMNFKQAAFGAAKYLGQFKKRGIAGMLAAYNAGPAGNPNNPETRAYIPAVQRFARQFRRGGGDGQEFTSNAGERMGNIKEAKKAIREFNKEAKRAQKLAKIDAKIAGLEQLRAFKDAIKGIRDQVKDLASQAAAAWRATREAQLTAERDAAIAAVGNSPEARELAALQAEDARLEKERTEADLNKNLTDATAARVEAEKQYAQDGSKTYKDEWKKALDEAKAAEKAAQDAIADYNRGKREAELTAWLEGETTKAETTYDNAVANLDAEELAFATSMENRLGILTDGLESQKTVYAKWAKEVNKILAAYGLAVETSPDQEAAVGVGPGSKPKTDWAKERKNGKYRWPDGKGYVHSRPYQGRAMGGPVMAGVPYEVGERGREVFVPETNGRIIPNHRLPRRGSGVGDIAGGLTQHFHGTINIGSRKAAEVAVNRLTKKVAFG